MITVVGIDPAPPEGILYTTSVSLFPQECWVSCLPIEETTFIVNDPANIPKYQTMGYREVITMDEYLDLDRYDDNYYDEYPYDEVSYDNDEYPDEDLTP